MPVPSKFHKPSPSLRRGSGRASPLLLMSALSSLSPLFLSRPTFLNAKPVSNVRLIPYTRIQSFKNYSTGENLNNTPSSEKKSLTVATGEFFLGLASFLIKNRVENRRSPTIWMDNEEEFGVEGDTEVKFRDRREGIASYVRDTVDQDVVWEQRSKDVEAEREREKVTSPGFSFSAAGLLLPYHLGVSQYLIEEGYIKETTPLAGSSAGAIACAIIASGTSMREALNTTKVLAEDCRLKGTAFRLGAVLRDVLKEFLPEDIHYRCNGRVRIAVTQLLWKPRGLLVDHFNSKEDFINALFTSSFIPGYLAPRPATYFRNRLCIDGGLTLFMPPTSASNTVRVCAFPAGRLGMEGIGISPDCNPENRASPRQLFNWALEPAEDDVLDNLFELGYLDAAAWGDQNPVEEIMKHESISPNTS